MTYYVGQSITATASAAPDVAQMFAWSKLVSAPLGPQTLLSTVKTQTYSAGPPVVPALYTATFTPTTPGTWVVRFADSMTPPTTGGYVEEYEFVVFPLDYFYGDSVPSSPVVPGAGGSVYGPLTTVTAGASPTLNAANVQRVNIPTDGAASGIVYPAAPSDGDIIYGKTTGTSVVNAATINPNGNNIESIRSPGTIGAGNITTGPNLGNPAVSWVHVYEASGTVWRLR